MSHTPGPWKVRFDSVPTGGDDYESSAEIFATKDGRRALIAYVHERDQDQDDNARLIAAAPDLLEALKEVARSPQRNCAKDHDPPGSGYGGCDCAGDMARAAIAKTEGKS